MNTTLKSDIDEEISRLLSLDEEFQRKDMEGRKEVLDILNRILNHNIRGI